MTVTIDRILLGLLPLAACLCFGGCRGCKSDVNANADAIIPGHAVKEDPTLPDAMAPPLPEILHGALGLTNADPVQDATALEPVMPVRRMLMAGDYDQARTRLDEIMEAHPGNLEAMYLEAGIMARTLEGEEAVDALVSPLGAALPWFLPRVENEPDLAFLRDTDPEAWMRLERLLQATRLAWAEALTGPGAFVLVATAPEVEGVDDPEPMRLNRGWVVFLDAHSRRFMPLARDTTVAGFLIDRRLSRIYLLSWQAHERELRDEGGVMRPALLNGVEVTFVDLATLEHGSAVKLGDGIASVRLAARSDLLLAAIETVDPAIVESVLTYVSIDWDAGKAETAHEAAPGPMDLVVRYGSIDPPRTQPDDAQDPDALPNNAWCLAPGDGLRLCSVPSSKKSVLFDLVIEDMSPGSETGSTTVASGLGILQMNAW